MPRKPREEIAGAVHHVYARGNRRQLIYRDQRDFQRYLSLIGEVVPSRRWACMAYCLMPNHLHLLIETALPNLGQGMQWLQSRYAAHFNKRYGISGHVFQGRYGAVRVTSDAQLSTVVAYIAHNPVEAGLCAEPQDWRWSSHASLFNGSAPSWLATGRLCSYFAGAGGQAAAQPAERLRPVRPAATPIPP